MTTVQTQEEQQQSKQGPAANIRWTLEDLLPARSGKIFQSFLDQFESALVDFEQHRSSLTDSITAETLLSIIQKLEDIVKMRYRLGAYAQLFFSEDNRSQEARTFKARSDEIDVDATNRTLFFELWWKGLDGNLTNKLMARTGKYTYFLKRLIQTKPYTLSEPVEQAINLKDSTGRTILLQIYHQIRDAGPVVVKIGDRVEELSEEQARDLFRSPIREERRATYVALLTKFSSKGDVLGEIYKAIARDWRNEAIKLRKYRSPIAVRNVANDISDEAVNTLLEVCRENANVFQEYFALKGKLLEISDFSRIDTLAPLPASEETSYTWEEGVRLVTDTFNDFDPKFAEFANRVFRNRHIDAEIREGKMSGAFCMGVTPEVIPYVLTSYTGKARSVSTLAHELGHAIHDQFSGEKNSQLTYDSPLPLAETASVFSEMLLTDKLMSKSDDNTKRSLLVEMIDEEYSTIMRQAFFVLFELEAHDSIAKGVNLDDLSAAYYSNLRTQFGQEMEIPEEFKGEWLGIPHLFQSPFYCYAYAWGNLLVLSLYKRFRERGPKDFIPQYTKILSYGGSESPETILSEAGFDVRSKDFWRDGFAEISRSISSLKALVS